MTEKRISEFNYKLLNGILNNNVFVSKWNKDVSPLCEICKTEEDTKHLLYDCKMNKSIWQKVNSFFNFDITWKIIVLGFFYENNEKVLLLNNLIAFITFIMYKYKMKCRIKNESISETNLRRNLKYELFTHHAVLKNIGKVKNDIYYKIGNAL